MVLWPGGKTPNVPGVLVVTPVTSMCQWSMGHAWDTKDVEETLFTGPATSFVAKKTLLCPLYGSKTTFTVDVRPGLFSS